MILYFLFSVSYSKKIICICNNECHPFCQYDIFNASSPNSRFQEFITSHAKGDKEIDLNFYSKQKGFTFKMHTSYFGDAKVIINVLPDSQSIKLKIKQNFQIFSKNIEIKPNYKVILPNLTPLPNKINHSKKNILEDPIATTIPVSVSIRKMETQGTATCVILPNEGNSQQPQYSINQDLYEKNFSCEKADLASSHAYNCGLRCWSDNIIYKYTFKGVKFGIYGSNDPENHKFIVELDNNFLTEVNEEKTNREEYVLVYTSPLLEYKEHTVGIKSEDQTYEIYKIVFWPSIRAKRINSTEINKIGNWVSYTDGVGGSKYCLNNVGTGSIKLNCMKFWLYGTGTFTISFNNITENITVPRKGYLLYESPYLNIFNFELKFSAQHDSEINCIYYEEPYVPISVGILQMEHGGYDNCGFYTNTSTFKPISLSDVQFLGCNSNDLSSQNAHKCGVKCWGNFSNYEYTFKGVKFALYGTFDPNHGNLQ